MLSKHGLIWKLGAESPGTLAEQGLRIALWETLVQKTIEILLAEMASEVREAKVACPHATLPVHAAWQELWDRHLLSQT